MIKRAEIQQDKWEIDEDNKDVTVYDEYGVKIIYQESLNDMLEIEEELIKIGTYFINQAEYQSDPDSREPSSAIDRGEVTLDLFEHETLFQFEKLHLLLFYLESYEHCVDPLELLRLAQVITDLMISRPRLNAEGAYFVDNYRSEIEVLKQKGELIREIIAYQAEEEREANKEIRIFNELKYRKINDLIIKQEENIEYKEGK